MKLQKKNNNSVLYRFTFHIDNDDRKKIDFNGDTITILLWLPKLHVYKRILVHTHQKIPNKFFYFQLQKTLNHLFSKPRRNRERSRIYINKTRGHFSV